MNLKCKGTCWCPANQVNAIQLVLDEGAAQSGTDARPIFTQCDTTRKPPTYHITDKYTTAFQTIVDAYGVATYQEVNPAPFTIITFPFLFAVMFGDFGHGIIMARRRSTQAAPPHRGCAPRGPLHEGEGSQILFFL